MRVNSVAAKLGEVAGLAVLCFSCMRAQVQVVRVNVVDREVEVKGVEGVGVMIRRLCGNEEATKLVQGAIGKTLESATMVGDALELRFVNGGGIRLLDKGQSCCESRYMTTDDELDEFKGSTLLSFELAEGPTDDSDYDTHEVQFLHVKTSKGVFTMETHNEHNGYYGGFYIAAEELE